MGLLGGDSRSSSEVINKVSNVTQGAQDGGLLVNVAGGNSGDGGGGTTVTVTDGESIARAFDFGAKALDTSGAAVNQALTFAQKAGENALKFAFDAGRPNDANARVTVYVAGGVAALFVVTSLINNKKIGAKKK